LGIGPIPQDVTIVDFVLGRFTEDENLVVSRSVASAVEALLFVVEHGVVAAMNEFNC
jgi:peptidyl-tRNA hydrolase